MIVRKLHVPRKDSLFVLGTLNHREGLAVQEWNPLVLSRKEIHKFATHRQQPPFVDGHRLGKQHVVELRRIYILHVSEISTQLLPAEYADSFSLRGRQEQVALQPKPGPKIGERWGKRQYRRGGILQ